MPHFPIFNGRIISDDYSFLPLTFFLPPRNTKNKTKTKKTRRVHIYKTWTYLFKCSTTATTTKKKRSRWLHHVRSVSYSTDFDKQKFRACLQRDEMLMCVRRPTRHLLRLWHFEEEIVNVFLFSSLSLSLSLPLTIQFPSIIRKHPPIIFSLMIE